jgi:protein gp37
MNKTNIEWCDYTWNPITGCKRGCSYCYAKKLHNRFNKTPFEEITFHEERMFDSFPKKPSVIFVGSMSDIAYWTPEMVHRVLCICRGESFKKHTFMFLSKDASAYDGYEWPENTMQGLTMTGEEVIVELQDFKRKQIMACPRPYLSVEPILGTIKTNLCGFEKIIVGAMTGHKAIKPETEWIESIKKHAHGAEIFWKSNIKQFLTRP